MPYVTNITYNQYGERQRIDYGNGTSTEYDYDDLRRMDELKHTFSTHDILKQYAYDKVSNVIKIATDPLQNLNIMPTNGELAGPLEHNYTYDDFNRLIKADGWYVGPDDEPSALLRQEYTLDMAYDESHNILNKAQNHLRGSADPNDPNIFPSNVVPEAMEDTAYNLDYEDYASGSFTTGGHSYVQPHAPRTIVEYPYGGGADEPSAKRKLLDYDANGNLLLVEQEISDPEDPLGKAKISLRENLWDEENRLRAVDLKPEAPSNKPEVAAYTYDASGERTIKYLPGRLDAYYSAKAAGSGDRLESILYPSPLLTVKTRPLPEHMEPDELSRTSITKYTKHYYIGTERISSALGTMKNLGLLCENNWPGNNDLVNEMGTKTIDAGSVLIADYDAFEKELQLSEPFIYETYLLCVTGDHEPKNYDAYWYHPDHLGSSSYISNTSGEVSQHMEYLPFGETLVEEHLNSYNSPYKFNAKEYDAETGWYYYGARYYNPKWSIWLGVDPLAEMYPSMSPYAYTLQNPVRYVDPDGRAPEDVIIIFNKSTGKIGIVDLDHYQSGLPTVKVSAADYKLGGIRDKDGNLTHNQILVMNNIFSGGRSDGNGNITRDLTRDKAELPIPNGRYDLTEYEGNKNWYKVDPIDESRYDDHHQGYKNSDGKTRSGYRFHLGMLSHGCITCDSSQEGRQEEWNVVQAILESTSKTLVPKREGNQKWNPFSFRLKYGEIRVQGNDNENIKQIFRSPRNL